MPVVPFKDPQSSKDSSARDVSDSWFDDESEGGKMSFLEHLDELRKRIIRALLSLCLGIGIVALFHPGHLRVRDAAAAATAAGRGELIYTYPTEAFMLYLRIAIIAGLVIAAPLIFWQVWLFVAPALYAKERRYAIPFVSLSSIGFIAGAAFSHYVAFPLMWVFFGSFQTDFVTFMPRIEDAFGMYIRMLLGMGLVFQMPALVFFLARMGVVTARWMMRQFKYAVLVIFIVAAVITPSADVASQLIVGVPMIGLYILSIAIAWIVGPKKRNSECADSVDWTMLDPRISRARSVRNRPCDFLRFHLHHLLSLRRSRSSTTPSFSPFAPTVRRSGMPSRSASLNLTPGLSPSRSSWSTSNPAPSRSASI